MTKDIANEDQVPFFGEDSFDALETGVRRQIRRLLSWKPSWKRRSAVGP